MRDKRSYSGDQKDSRKGNKSRRRQQGVTKGFGPDTKVLMTDGLGTAGDKTLKQIGVVGQEEFRLRLPQITARAVRDDNEAAIRAVSCIIHEFQNSDAITSGMTVVSQAMSVDLMERTRGQVRSAVAILLEQLGADQGDIARFSLVIAYLEEMLSLENKAGGGLKKVSALYNIGERQLLVPQYSVVFNPEQHHIQNLYDAAVTADEIMVKMGIRQPPEQNDFQYLRVVLTHHIDRHTAPHHPMHVALDQYRQSQVSASRNGEILSNCKALGAMIIGRRWYFTARMQVEFHLNQAHFHSGKPWVTVNKLTRLMYEQALDDQLSVNTYNLEHISQYLEYVAETMFDGHASQMEEVVNPSDYSVDHDKCHVVSAAVIDHMTISKGGDPFWMANSIPVGPSVAVNCMQKSESSVISARYHINSRHTAFVQAKANAKALAVSAINVTKHASFSKQALSQSDTVLSSFDMEQLRIVNEASLAMGTDTMKAAKPTLFPGVGSGTSALTDEVPDKAWFDAKMLDFSMLPINPADVKRAVEQHNKENPTMTRSSTSTSNSGSSAAIQAIANSLQIKHGNDLKSFKSLVKKLGKQPKDKEANKKLGGIVTKRVNAMRNTKEFKNKNTGGKKGSESKPKTPCTKCQPNETDPEKFHWSNKCPAGETRTCHNCQKAGHLMKDCTVAKVQSIAADADKDDSSDDNGDPSDDSTV